MRSMHLKPHTREALAGVLFVCPFAIGAALFYAAPFVVNAISSVTTKAGGRISFSGIANYTALLRNWAFQLAMKNTLLFTAIGISLLIICGLGLALLLSRPWIRLRLFRSVSLLPMILPGASLILAWQLFFQDYGIINQLLLAGGKRAIYFFDTQWGLWLIIFLYVWKNTGYIMILFMTGLSQIPRELYEASLLDGAGPLRQFIRITLPCLRPTMYLAILVAMLNSQKIYREVYHLAGNYPFEGIYMLQHFMNNNFDKLDYARLSTAAMLYSLLLFVVLVPLFYMERKSFDLG